MAATSTAESPAPAADSSAANLATAPAPAASTAKESAPTPAKSGASKASAPAPAESAEAVEPKVVTYDFKLPEGANRDEGYISRLESRARKLNLSPEQAQGMLDEDYAHMAAQRAAWREALKSDPELSGDLATKIDQGRAVIAKHGGGELLEALNTSGLGDFPPFVKFIVALGAQSGEPRSVVTSDKSAKGDPLRAMFNHPTSAKLFKDGK